MQYFVYKNGWNRTWTVLTPANLDLRHRRAVFMKTIFLNFKRFPLKNTLTNSTCYSMEQRPKRRKVPCDGKYCFVVMIHHFYVNISRCCSFGRMPQVGSQPQFKDYLLCRQCMHPCHETKCVNFIIKVSLFLFISISVRLCQTCKKNSLHCSSSDGRRSHRTFNHPLVQV